MIVDTSVLIAIATSEQGSDHLLAFLHVAQSPRISAGNLLEMHVVIERRRNAPARARLEDLLLEVALIVEPVTEAQVNIAHAAYRRYGKGSGHPAQLNYGDCFAYSLARMLNEPLLFIGNDFSQTDITPAL